MAEILIDTNILVYAHHPAEASKYTQAVQAIAALTDSGEGRLSVQVLGEFVSATTRGRQPILSLREALDQTARLADALPVYDVTRLVVLEAIRGVRQHRLSYYDAQIWATARLNQVPTVFTEDFQDGGRLEGVQFVNPLVAGFDLGCSVLDRLVTDARTGRAGATPRSVVGTIDVDPSDPLLLKADDVIRALVAQSIGRPMIVKEKRSTSRAGARKRRG